MSLRRLKSEGLRLRRERGGKLMEEKRHQNISRKSCLTKRNSNTSSNSVHPETTGKTAKTKTGTTLLKYLTNSNVKISSISSSPYLLFLETLSFVSENSLHFLTQVNLQINHPPHLYFHSH